MGKKEDLIKEARRLELIAEARELEGAQAPGKQYSPAEIAAQSLRSGVEGLTLGLSEPVISGMMAVQQQVKHAAGAESIGDAASSLVDVDNLKREYDADVARRKQFEKDNPGTAMTAEMTGAMVPAVFTGGETLAAKLLTAGPEAIAAAGTSAAQLVRQFPKLASLLEGTGVMSSAARVAEAGGKAAVQAVTAQAVKDAAQVPTGFEDAKSLEQYGDIAKTGAAFGGGLQAIPEAALQASRTAKGAARVFGGVRGETIDKYLANPERIRNAPSIAEIKDEVDSTVQKLRDDFDNAKITKEEAQQAFRDAQNRVDDLVRENKNIVAGEKADLKSAFKSAQSDLDLAFKAKKSEIKNARMPVQVDDVLDSVEKVKDQVSELSEESYKILGLHKGRFKLNGVTKQITALQNQLKVEGQLLSGDSEKAFNALGGWKEKLKAIGAENDKGLEASQMKRVIQEIDRDLRKYSDKMAGDFSDVVYNELLGMRRLLDSKLKDQVAGYREVMEETARLNQLRGEFVKLFGSRERVSSKLARLDNPNLEFERGRLRELGTLSGKDWGTAIDDFTALKGQGRSQVALDQVKQNLPENEAYVTALADYARTQRPEYGQDRLLRAAQRSPEAQAARAAEGSLSAATDDLAAKKAALEPFRRITPMNSENQIRTLMGDRSRKLELKKLMGQLGQVSDQDFVQMIDDLRVQEAFEKGNAHGSSNVNLWGAIAGATGFVLGDPTLGLSSAGAGAAFGKIMDSYGPKITKKVLDGIVFMKGIPTVQKINEAFADLPDPLREQLKSDLVRAVTIGNTTRAVSIPAEQRAELARDLRTSQNLSATEKARAITEINKRGALGSDTLQKVMVGDEKAEPVQIQRPVAEPPPKLEQVTDFIKNRKQEAY